MFQEFNGVGIKGIAATVPRNVVTNSFFEDLLSPKELRIFEKTVNITERRWADESVTASDLGYEAASLVLEKFPAARNEITALIFLSQTPDFKIPFTSNILQERLNLPTNILCLDLNAGCAGFVQGLGTAFSLAQTTKNGKVLLIVAETMSKIISRRDRGTSMLFGDGAAAILVENNGDGRQKAFFNYFSDGLNSDAIAIPDGGYRSPVTAKSLQEETDEKMNTRHRLHLAMDGPRVFDFTLREVAPGITELLGQADIDINDIDQFLLHQSNEFIIKQIASQLKVSPEKMLLNISRFGNTSGVSIPLLMVTEQAKSPKLLLGGYGVGLNWANCVLENMEYEICDLKEI